MELPDDSTKRISERPAQSPRDCDGPSKPSGSDILLRKKERDGHIQLGVAFRNFNVYGFSSSDQHQHTAASYILDLPMILARLFKWRERSKSHILRECSGLLRSGEMLLVLGRPGSGCSTFLKVLAGETRGLHVDDVSKINYDGGCCSN